MKKNLLIFHPVIAPYRVDFFNSLCHNFNSNVYLMRHNLLSQKFDYKKIEERFTFKPEFLTEKYINLIPKGILRALKSNAPDIVIVSECGFVTLFVIMYKYLFRKNYRVVSMIDDSYNMLVEGNQFSKKHALAERLLLPLLDDVITIEPRVASFMKDKYGKGLFFPIIVDDVAARNRYKRILPLSETIVKHYQLEQKKVMLFVGRLVELKNLQTIIPIFSTINDSDYRFVIIGDGSFKDTLQKMAKGDNRIIFAGRKEGDDLYAWYNIANSFILPSFQEAFGAVTNEALLGGCWSIVSNKAGSQCLINDGVNGNIIDINNINDIKHSIQLALERSRPITLPLILRDNKMIYEFKCCIKDIINSCK